MTCTPSGALRATVKSTESSQLTELADTDPADWNMQQAGAGLATDAPGKEAALLAGEPAKPKVTKETLYSTAKVHSIFNGNGHLGKHFYRFQNVRLTKKSLTFYMKPGGSGGCAVRHSGRTPAAFTPSTTHRGWMVVITLGFWAPFSLFCWLRLVPFCAAIDALALLRRHEAPQRALGGHGERQRIHA